MPLSPATLEFFEKISHEAAKRASDAFAVLIGKQTAVLTLSVRTISVKDVVELMIDRDPTEMMTHITQELSGDISGNTSILYTHEHAKKVANYMNRKEGEGEGEGEENPTLSELDRSALLESGNILTGSFLSCIGNALEMDIDQSPPEVATDMIMAAVGKMLINFSKQAKGAIAFEVDFQIGTKELQGYFFLLLDTNSTKTLSEKIRKQAESYDA